MNYKQYYIQFYYIKCFVRLVLYNMFPWTIYYVPAHFSCRRDVSRHAFQLCTREKIIESYSLEYLERQEG